MKTLLLSLFFLYCTVFLIDQFLLEKKSRIDLPTSPFSPPNFTSKKFSCRILKLQLSVLFNHFQLFFVFLHFFFTIWLYSWYVCVFFCPFAANAKMTTLKMIKTRFSETNSFFYLNLIYYYTGIEWANLLATKTKIKKPNRTEQHQPTFSTGLLVSSTPITTVVR